MILLMNVFITNRGLNKYDRGGLPNYDRFDIFKYTLASYAAIPWFDKCIFNIKLDTEYIRRREELEAYIVKLFSGRIDHCLAGRCERQTEWLKELERIPKDSTIWLACNDDHPFIDYNLDCLEACLYSYDKDPEPLKAIYYSHWVEPYRHAKASFNIEFFNSFRILPNGVLRTEWDRKDSIQIVSHALLTKWWTEIGNTNEYLPRPDFGGHWLTSPYRCFIPPRELCRHFDGASHLFHPKDVPPLTIPKGWNDTWEKKTASIEEHDLDYTYFVPFFWRKNAELFGIMQEIKQREYHQARRKYAMAHTSHPDFQELPDEQWLLQGDPKW